jgi:UDP-N-acetylglucosamine acyltransferase
MATTIHPTAIIHASAKIGDGTTIGPYAVVEEDVIIGDNCEIHAHALIAKYTRLGNSVRVFSSAALGTEPQDLKFGGEKTVLEIGDNTVIRECAMLSRGTSSSGKTVVGKNCLIMAYVHLGHDVVVGDNVILANSVQVAGHVTIGNWVGIGGQTGVHQFCRIGDHCFIEGVSKVKKDVPPFILAMSTPLVFAGLNAIGLKRRGFNDEQLVLMKKAYKIYFKSGKNHHQAIEKIKSDVSATPEVNAIVDFLESSERGIIQK